MGNHVSTYIPGVPQSSVVRAPDETAWVMSVVTEMKHQRYSGYVKVCFNGSGKIINVEKTIYVKPT